MRPPRHLQAMPPEAEVGKADDAFAADPQHLLDDALACGAPPAASATGSRSRTSRTRIRTGPTPGRSGSRSRRCARWRGSWRRRSRRRSRCALRVSRRKRSSEPSPQPRSSTCAPGRIQPAMASKSGRPDRAGAGCGSGLQRRVLSRGRCCRSRRAPGRGSAGRPSGTRRGRAARRSPRRTPAAGCPPAP